MPAVDPNDWRLTQGADVFLRDAELQWKTYRKWSDQWDHDHCVFCWAKFVEPSAYAWYLENRSAANVYTEGYTTTQAHESGAGYYWVCQPCFDDFREYVSLRIAS